MRARSRHTSSAWETVFLQIIADADSRVLWPWCLSATLQTRTRTIPLKRVFPSPLALPVRGLGHIPLRVAPGSASLRRPPGRPPHQPRFDAPRRHPGATAPCFSRPSSRLHLMSFSREIQPCDDNGRALNSSTGGGGKSPSWFDETP